MIKTVRIGIPYDKNKTMEQSLSDALSGYGLTVADVSFESLTSDPWDGSHFGNWVYVYAKDVPALRATNLFLDFEDIIAERTDLEKFRPGDKVTVCRRNQIAMTSQALGKVYKTYEQNGRLVVEVLAKGTRSGKGYRIYEGKANFIRAGWEAR